LTPGEKRGRKRMAQVATVYSIAPFVRSAADIVHPLRDRAKVEAKRPRPTDFSGALTVIHSPALA
jgi:hypothetical protein